MQLMIMVKQVVTMPPESGMGFTELHHQDVKVLENSIPGTLIKTLEIGQKPDRDIKIKCDIVEVINDKGEKVRNPGRSSFFLMIHQSCRWAIYLSIDATLIYLGDLSIDAAPTINVIYLSTETYQILSMIFLSIDTPFIKVIYLPIHVMLPMDTQFITSHIGTKVD